METPEATYKALCQRCHGDKGDGLGVIAQHLDPSPRDFTKAGFMNSKPVTRLTDSIRNGVAGTSMPAWGKLLDEAKAKSVLDYIQASFVKEPRRELAVRQVPDTNPVPMSKESVARGAAIFAERCTGCHGKKADGKGPNSLDISPKPRNLRNAWFVNSVADRRLFESILYGVQGTAMPSWIDYGFNNNDVGDLVNFIRRHESQTQGRAACSSKLAGWKAAARRGRHRPRGPHRRGWFMLSSVAYFFIVGISRPDHRRQVRAGRTSWAPSSWLTYGRLRPLHVNGMLFGWLLAADMGLTFYIVPRLCGVKLWSEKLGVATGHPVERHRASARWSPCSPAVTKGLEYAELITSISVLVVVAWLMFARQHLHDHRQPEVPGDVRDDLVHHGLHPVDGVRLPHRQLRHPVHHRREPGQPELDVHPQRRGADLHADRPGHRLLLHPPRLQHPPAQPQAVHDRLLVAGLRLRLDRRPPHAPRAHLPVAADHRHRLLA